MLRRVLLTAALSLVLAVFAGHGSFTGGVVHAAGTGPGAGSIDAHESCDSSYHDRYPAPYIMRFCNLGETDNAPGVDGGDNDYDNPGTQNEVGTVSFSGSGCEAASIATGEIYYNPTSYVEFDTVNPFTEAVTYHARCTVQTGDALGSNLFATLVYGGFSVQLNDTTVSQPLATQLYETESPTGVVTLYLTATVTPC